MPAMNPVECGSVDCLTVWPGLLSGRSGMQADRTRALVRSGKIAGQLFISEASRQGIKYFQIK